MSPLARAALLTVLGALATTPARAELPATIGGVVSGPDGRPLDRARVILRGHGLGENGRQTETDARGQFALRGIAHGSYDLVARYPGLVSAVAKGVVAHAGRRTETRLTLAEHETPEGARDLRSRAVDVTETGRVHTLNRAFLELLPSDRTLAGSAQLLPGVIGEDGAGLEIARTGYGQVAIHGQAKTRARFRLDGLSLNDPHTGLLSSAPAIDAIGDLRVQTAGIDAEHGRAAGGLVDATSRRPTDQFALDAAVFAMPSALRFTDVTDGELRDHTTFQLLSAGPILRGRLWYSLSAQYLDEVSVRTGVVPVFDDVPLIVPRSSRALRVLGRLAWRPFEWQQLSLFLLGDPQWSTNVRQDPRVHPEAERQSFEGGVTLGLNSRTRFTEDVQFEARLGYSTERAQLFPESGDVLTPGTVRDTGEATGNDTVNIDDFHQRVETAAALTGVFELFGEHELKLGGEADLMWSDIDRSIPGGAILLEEQRGEDLVLVGSINQLAAVEREVWGNSTALFAQDTWRPLPTFTVRAGLRYETSRAFADPVDGGEAIYDFAWVSPRVGVAWDPFGDGRTVARVGYYQYADLGLLSHAELAIPGIRTSVEAPPGHEVGALQTPILHEILAGFERELITASVLGAHVIYRRKDGLIEDREVNIQWDAAGESPVGFADGQPRERFVLETARGAYHEYLALELSFERPYKAGWGLYASYTISQLGGTSDDTIGRALDNPREVDVADGLLAGDVTHRALISIAWDLPLGLKLATTARYQSGRPIARIGGRQLAPRGFDTDGTALRTDDVFILDGRVLWSLLPLTDQDIAMSFDVLNTLGGRAALTVDERDGPTFGDTLSRTPPLAVRLGLRYRF